MSAAPLVTAHLSRLTTDLGLFEHAEGDRPRPEHGFCVDDVARALVVVVREPERTPDLDRLVGVYLDFVLAAQSSSGAFRNRRDIEGVWTDAPTTDDHWGRALWALGTVVSTSGQGEKAEATIDFGAEGTKRLLLRYAPVEKL